MECLEGAICTRTAIMTNLTGWPMIRTGLLLLINRKVGTRRPSIECLSMLPAGLFFFFFFLKKKQFGD